MFKIILKFLNKRYDYLLKKYLASLRTKHEYRCYRRMRAVVLKINRIEDRIQEKKSKK